MSRSTHRGFGLVEVVVYIAIFIIVSVGSVILLLTLQKQVYEYQARQALVRNATGAMERIMLDMRAADTITTGTYGSSPGTITLGNGATTTVYTLATGNINVSVNGGQAVPLTGSPVTATSLVFNKFDNGVSEAVQVSFTLQSTVGTGVVTENFTNTTILLGSYE